MHQGKSTKISYLVLIVVVFFAAMILLTPAFPDAFAHGGHQPAAADFEGKKASIFAKRMSFLQMGKMY